MGRSSFALQDFSLSNKQKIRFLLALKTPQQNKN